jgi:hypothetical protein
MDESSRRAGDVPDDPGARCGGAMEVTSFLFGHVMTGFRIDQVQPHLVDPTLYEPCIPDARA